MANRSNAAPADRAPVPLGVKQHLLAIILVVASMTASEAFWRSQGHAPGMTVNDVATRLDYNLWSDYRQLVSINDRNTLVLAGDSRLQAGFSIERFLERYPDHKIAQLAIPNGNPIATLRNLAEDDNFSGVVICGILTPSLARFSRDRDRNTVASYRRDSSLNTRLNARWSALLKSNFVMLNNELNLAKVARGLLLNGKLPLVSRVYYSRKRSLLFDFDKIQPNLIAILRNDFRNNTRRRLMFWSNSPENWLAEAKEIEWMVDTIHARGGEVWFVRMPSSGTLWELSNLAWPRDRYWQLFADTTSAGTIHFQDVPGMTELELPDFSHLDYKDAPRFTDLLLDEITRQGGLEPG